MALLCALTIFFRSRNRRHLKRELANARQVSQQSIRAVETVIDMMRDLMDTAAICGDNPHLLQRKIRMYLFIDPKESPKSIIRKIPEIADFMHGGIISYLRTEYPLLRDEELFICSLLILRFPAHALQLLFNYSNPGSYYNKKCRIRQKMRLPKDETSLEHYLEALCEKIERRSYAERRKYH